MGKWDFDPDELFFFVLAAIIGIGGAFVWYLRILTVRNLAGQGSRSRLLLALTPPLNLIALVLVLQRWSDPQYVVGQLDYILMFACGCAMWLWFGKAFSALLGISARDDALERGN